MDPDGIEIDNWLQAAIADAERRGLPELRPLLEGLARATRGLREADLAARREAADPTQVRRG